jgi:signal transduction histidine kinase
LLDFSIEPAYYQTRWFQAVCIGASLAMLWGLYRFRLYQMAQRFNLRMEERVTERTRIARELHDTLLQSFQGLLLRLQVVEYLLPEGEAKDQFEQTLQRADQAIAEGRTAVYDLRSSTTTTNDLAEAVKALGEELATPESAAFRVEVVGASRDLHPVIRDEIYRIAREALRNAFGHAEARHVETELSYDQRGVRLRIRDDGKGIPAEFLEEGRRGHYGLCGMRERAGQIGGKLEIWSRPGAGTEIELSITASIAYRTPTGRPRFRFFRRKQVEV